MDRTIKIIRWENRETASHLDNKSQANEKIYTTFYKSIIMTGKQIMKHKLLKYPV